MHFFIDKKHENLHTDSECRSTYYMYTISPYVLTYTPLGLMQYSKPCYFIGQIISLGLGHFRFRAFINLRPWCAAGMHLTSLGPGPLCDIDHLTLIWRMDQSLLAEEAKRGIRPCQIWVDSWRKKGARTQEKKVSQSVRSSGSHQLFI